MKLVRNRADARWLPSRYRYALFRLMAWAIFRAVGPKPRRGIVMAVDRDQSALESYSMAVWLTLTSSCLAFAMLNRVLPAGPALVVSPFAALAFLQGVTSVVSIAGAAGLQRSSGSLVSLSTMFLVTVAAIHVAGYDGWPRLAAWAFLLVLGLNAIAAAIAHLFREQLIDTEKEIAA